MLTYRATDGYIARSPRPKSKRKFGQKIHIRTTGLPGWKKLIISPNQASRAISTLIPRIHRWEFVYSIFRGTFKLLPGKGRFEGGSLSFANFNDLL